MLADDYRLRGPDHRETLAARSNLARVIGLRGRYAEAEDLSRQVLDAQRQVLGPDHPDCLASRQNLARLATKAGRYAEAEQMYRRLLTDRRRVLGEYHPDTLATRHRLARIIGLQGRYADAEELCYQVLRDRRRLLGEDHPDNLSTRHRLARMLSLQGRYADAEPMFRQVLAARRRVLGEDHPDTLSTEHRLGWLVGRQGRLSMQTNPTFWRTPEAMLAQGVLFDGLAPNIIVKFPATAVGIGVMEEATYRGVSVNCTVSFSVAQALFAAKAGAYSVSAFMGRVDDIGGNGVAINKTYAQEFRASSR